MTNKRIQLSTNVDGQNVNVYPVTKSEFVEFSDGKTLNDKLNNMDGNHEHGLATPAKDGFMSKEDKAKLDGVNNYTHPSTHAATMITEDATHRFVTDAEKTKWDNKADTTMASKTNAGLMSASDKQRIDGLNAEFKTRDDKITKNTEDIKSWNDEMVNKEYQYFNGENVTINNSIVSKTTDMVIKGRTLHNLIRMKDYVMNDLGVLEDNTFKINKTTETAGALTFKLSYLNTLKTNTVYTVMAKISNNTLHSSVHRNFNLVHCYQNVMLTKTAVSVDFGYNGIICKTFTTSDVFPNEGRLEINFAQGTQGTVNISNMMIFEGDMSNEFIDGYFEDIKSFGQQEDKISILSHGKNLCKVEEFSTIAINSSVESYSSLDKVIESNIEVDPNKTYTLSYTSTISGFNGCKLLGCNIPLPPKITRHNDAYVFCTNNGGQEMSQKITGFKYITITTGGSVPANIIKVGETISIVPQLEEGSVPTPYEPYKYDKKDILIKSPLREWDSMYEDNGQVKVDRYTSVIDFSNLIINVSEVSERPNAQSTNWFQTNYIPQLKNAKKNTLNFNNKYVCVDAETAWKDTNDFECLSVAVQEGGVRIQGRVKKGTTIEQLNEKLRGLIIYYQLATPTTEVVENCVDINLKTFNERTYITSDNIIKGDLSFTVPMNTAANLENNTTRLNTIEDYVDNNKDNKNKISKLEEGAVTSSLNIIDLQKEIINKDDYIKYEDKNIFINKNKEMQICNTIIKGDTLVNHILTPFKDKVYYGNSTSQREIYKVSIKPNTKYTIIADVVENSLNNNFSIISWKQTKDEQAIVIKPGQCGVIKKTYVSKDNDIYEYNTEVWRECTQGGIAINYMMILEGDWTEKDIPDYFEGIKGCGILNNNGTKIEIVNCSNNLFKELNFNIDPIGTNKIKLKLPLINKKNQYLISWDSFNITKPKDNWTPIIGAVYTDGTSLETYINQVNHIITDENKTVEYFYYRNPWAVGCTINNLQIKEGSEMSPYEPYKERKKEILINEFLNSGDYLFQEENDLKIYKKTGNLILNGENEDWKVWDNNPGDTVNAYVYFNRLAIDLSEVIKPKSNILNDKLPSNQGGYLSTKEGFRIINNYFAISIHKSKLGITNVNDPNNSILIKNWLKSNPISVVYELNTPNVKTVKEDYSLNLNLFNGKNYISSLGAIKAELSFDVPRNIATQNKENVENINNLTSLFDNKISKLESAQLSTALNVLELQKHTSMLDNGEINEYSNHTGTFIECNNTLDSRTENMVIRGNTLFNVSPKGISDCSQISAFNHNYQEIKLEQGEGFIKCTQPSAKKWNIIGYDSKILKPLTNYIHIADVEILNNPSNDSCIFHLGGFDYKKNKTITNGRATIASIGKTVNNLTGGNSSWIGIRLGGESSEGTNRSFKIYSISTYEITEEESNKDIDELLKKYPLRCNGIQSFGEDKKIDNKYSINILSHGKNFIGAYKTNKESGVKAVITKDNIEITALSRGGWLNLTLFYGLLEIGKTYTLSFDSYEGGKGDNVLCAVKKFRNGIEVGSYGDLSTNSNNQKTFTVTDDCEIGIRFFLTNNTEALNGDFIKFKKVQLIKSSEKSTYECYKSNKNNIIINQPLRKGDYIFEENKQIKIYRSKGQYTFTGNEQWQYGGESSNKNVCLYLQKSALSELLPNCNFDVEFNNNRNVISNNLLAISKANLSDTSILQNSNCISININGINLNISSLSSYEGSSRDVEKAKEWLKANPTTIIYQLATPVIEDLNSIDINVDTYKDNTYITTDNQIKGELEFKTQNNFGAIMKNVNRCISKIFNSLNNILNIKGE